MFCLKPYISIVLLTAILMGCTFFGPEANNFEELLTQLYSKTVPLIEADSLKALMISEKPIILDTRELAEYQRSHLPGAIYAGYSDFSLEAVKPLLGSERPVVVYCSVGYRSERIGEKLLRTKRKNVYNLYGGIFEWVNEGKLIVNMQEEPTDTVHAYSPKWGKWLTKGIKVYD